MSADVVGYSRLMGIDEAGTLERLKALGREIVDPELTLGRTHETENTGLRREANHAAVRRVVASFDDPFGRDPQPEWNRHLPTTID
jgi:hypothetical protein